MLLLFIYGINYELEIADVAHSWMFLLFSRKWF